MQDFNEDFLTISSECEGVYKEKGSKFIAIVIPVQSEEEIKNELERVRKAYFDARHHCYAWRLGADKLRFRVNDDGEPSGTAGKPILGQIQSFNLSNLLIVVVRYFGGVKLGTSGLIHAYKTAAQDALNQAEIIKMTVNEVYQIQYSYPVMNEIMKLVKDYQLKVHSSSFDNTCTLELSTARSRWMNLLPLFLEVDGCSTNLLRTEYARL